MFNQKQHILPEYVVFDYDLRELFEKDMISSATKLLNNVANIKTQRTIHPWPSNDIDKCYDSVYYRNVLLIKTGNSKMLIWIVLYLIGDILAYGALGDFRSRALPYLPWKNWEIAAQITYSSVSWAALLFAFLAGARGLKFNHRIDN